MLESDTVLPLHTGFGLCSGFSFSLPVLTSVQQHAALVRQYASICLTQHFTSMPISGCDWSDRPSCWLFHVICPTIYARLSFVRRSVSMRLTQRLTSKPSTSKPAPACVWAVLPSCWLPGFAGRGASYVRQAMSICLTKRFISRSDPACAWAVRLFLLAMGCV